MSKKQMALDMEKAPETDSLVSEVSEAFDEIQKLPNRLDRLSRAKRASDKTIQYGYSFLNGERDTDQILQSDLGPVLRRMEGCAEWLRFRYYYTAERVRLGNMHTCQVPLLCQFCAVLRAAKQLRAYFERFNFLMSGHPNLKAYLLTLTVANGEDLEERLKHLQDSFKIYCARRRDYFKKGRGFNEFCKIEGAVFTYEVTRSQKDFSWHPHIHAIILVDENNPIDFPHEGTNKQKNASKLSKEWHAITGDSYIVDCRPLSENPIDGFVEVFKYTLKFSEMHDWDKFTAYFKLRGKRLMGSFGLFRGVKVPENEADTMPADLPYVEMIYRFGSNGYEIFHVGQRAVMGGIELPGNVRSFVPMPTDGYTSPHGEFLPFRRRSS